MTSPSDPQPHDDDESAPTPQRSIMCATELVDGSSVLGRVTENI